MADDLVPIRNALTERAGDLARYLIGEPTAASKRELRWGRQRFANDVLRYDRQRCSVRNRLARKGCDQAPAGSLSTKKIGALNLPDAL